MADKNLELALKISADTSGAEAAVEDTVDSLEKLRRETDKPLKQIDQLDKLRVGQDSLTTGVIKSTQQMEKERVEIDRLEKSLAAAGVDTKNLAAEKARLEQRSISASQQIGNLRDRLQEMREASRAAASETRRAGDAAGAAGQKAGLGALGMEKLAAGFRLLGAIEVARQFLVANASMESMTLAMANITGSSEAAAREMAFVREEAGRLGIDINSAANSYVQLAASAKGTSLEGARTREIWSAVAEAMARLGKSSADTDGALLAISQMMSKGVVSAEELRGQLGERLPGAFQAAARAMGTTTQGLGEMLQSGQVIAADFLPKFAAELRKLGGGDINSFNAQISRLKNSFTELFVTIGDAGVFTAIGWVVEKTAQSINVLSDSMLFLIRVFVGTREELDAAVHGLIDAWKALFGLKTTSEETGKALDQVGDAGEQAGGKVAEGMGNAAAGAGKLSEVIKRLGDDLKLLGVDQAGIDEQMGLMEDRYVAAFQRISTSSAASSEAVFQSLVVAVDKVSGRDGLEKLRAAYYDTFRSGKVSADQFAVGLDAINTKTHGLWKNLTDTALAEQKRLESGLAASAKKREEIETEFARRRADINQPQGDQPVDFGALFDLQSRARELSARAGQATGEEAKMLSDEALATARQAADVVEKLQQSGQVKNIEASGMLKDIEGIAIKAADALMGVPITVDTSQAQAQAAEYHQTWQQFLDQNPLVVRVLPEGAGGTGTAPAGSGDLASAISQAALKLGGRR